MQNPGGDQAVGELQGRPVALVTGANRGIGKAAARMLADKGYHVLSSARGFEAAVAAVTELTTPNRHLQAVQLDVTDDMSVDRLGSEIAESTNQLDVLVNNAGAYWDGPSTASTADLNNARLAFDLHCLGTWRVSKMALGFMRANRHGRIVNVSTDSSFASPLYDGAGYRVSKAALHMLTLMLAHDVKELGILVNAVTPGWVRTDMGGPDAPRTVDEGAAGVVWAATLPDGGPSGGFFRDGEQLAW